VEGEVKQRAAGSSFIGRLLIAVAALLVVGLLASWIVFSRRNNMPKTSALTPASPASARPAAERGPAVSYLTDTVEEVPWTIHIVKVDRLQTNFSFETTLGRSNQIGMSLVSEQVKALPAALGRPMAAVNGDFYKNTSKYPGDPEGIQIAQGELVSAPRPTHSCFWIDAAGLPHITNIQSNFKITLPDGRTSSFGLNEERGADAVVLYTGANGSSTRTSGGIELVLAPTNHHALPLRAGETFAARLQQIRNDGNSPLSSTTLVLSVGPKIAGQVSGLKTNDVLHISTATQPQLTGSRTAIGGGPALVRGGAALSFSGIQTRHPRSAIGWNKEFFFLVEVDGRQKTSAGMTFPELAAYMAKLGCDEANNLDGGGSATLWVRGIVMNSPSEGRERPAANALVVLRKDQRD
jgi:exopolysaccharide biosynthesis protein